MADISSDNNPDATTIFNQDMMKLSEVVLDMDHNGITTETRFITHINWKVESLTLNMFRHEVTHGGHGGGWNDTTSIDKVSQYDSKVLKVVSGKMSRSSIIGR